MEAKRTVLLADDDLDLLSSTRELLEARFPDGRLRVLTARDGVEALELLHAERPHVLVLDLQMPRLDGVGLLRCMAGFPAFAAVRVILMSGDPDVAEVATAFGATAWLPKDGAMDRLCDTISRTLSQSDPEAEV